MNAVEKRDGKGVCVSQTPSSLCSALFRATFASRSAETDVIADQGANATFFVEDLLAEIFKESPNAKIVRLKTEPIYRGETGIPCLACGKNVKLEVYLKILHGYSLVLRNNDWERADKNVSVPIIGGRVLELLGCDN